MRPTLFFSFPPALRFRTSERGRRARARSRFRCVAVIPRSLYRGSIVGHRDLRWSRAPFVFTSRRGRVTHSRPFVRIFDGLYVCICARAYTCPRLRAARRKSGFTPAFRRKVTATATTWLLLMLLSRGNENRRPFSVELDITRAVNIGKLLCIIRQRGCDARRDRFRDTWTFIQVTPRFQFFPAIGARDAIFTITLRLHCCLAGAIIAITKCFRDAGLCS